ncbi:AMP-binding protein [Streptomyces sp. NPDC000229]|uniref:AMP-binding protein n=1 Tax=Streptomyces sp. NPDC000229 TaxID=3154247 RepID=UPI0033210208
MGYQELSPEELISSGHAAPAVNDTAWHVRWDALESFARREELVLGALPPEVDFHTSGSTGPSRCWRRTREDAWGEAGMLAAFLTADAPVPPGAVVAFAPPLHVYGALATLLVPARLGVPAWYRKAFVGAMPDTGQRHTVVVATPWIFSLLLRHIDWVRSFEHLTVLYSSAMLPADALTLLEEAGPGRVTLVELLGSTETGGIATRRWSGGEPPAWSLFPDVTFAPGDTYDPNPPNHPRNPNPPGGPATPATPDEAELTECTVPLVIRSPRLGHRPGEPRPDHWYTGDLVEPLDARTFRLAGRVGRLVKVNGRRINLDEMEHTLRARVDCEDLALVAVSDRMTGEQIDLYVVPRAGSGRTGADLSPVPALLGVRPRKVHVVPGISRSATGKLRHRSTPQSKPGSAT